MTTIFVQTNLWYDGWVKGLKMVIKRYVQKAKLESGEVTEILVEVEGINVSRMGYPEEWANALKQAYHLGEKLYWNKGEKCWELFHTGGKPIKFFPVD